MNLRAPCLSPDGRFEVTFFDREVFNTHWVQTPTLVDRQTGETLLTFDTRWTVDELEWTGASLISCRMRKYPGNHRPVELAVTIDAAARTASMGELNCPFSELERRMDAALEWIHDKEPASAPNLLARIRDRLKR